METLWFIIIGVLLTLFIVLDGFDFGTGIIYPWVAKNNTERRTVLSAIGPIWDGNEVWLIIGGGVLFFAFPTAYASIFSGYYLALMLLLWLLMFRGLSMELRSQLPSPLWHSFWDALLVIGSVSITLVLGVALGNVLRGVPLEADGFFFLPLWTDFMTGEHPGILDWYTLLTGAFAIVLFSVHGANFIALKTEQAIQQRARHIARKGNYLIALFMFVLPLATHNVQPFFIQNYSVYSIGVLLPILAGLALLAMFVTRSKENDLYAFAASAAFMVLLLLSVAFSIYPNMLIATTHSMHNLTIYNTATSEYALRTGLIWFSIGTPLALLYTLYMYRSFRGKVILSDDEEGY